ncbi:pyridoxamine 5'-phosphate oxidase family protein [Uruburuella testudinis]|uniref:Pyridoxamine 5'-phosphate oxidase family protein n=1 Tax=Uruburuella testudinis TaxID=1282863 RepID=A0ABY4DV32_9NEIS|nr:pyridoxamine 5'-phosphate oxidase family protein [Uruburuella testudinis]UOO82574.1 pyridoxamine 5'-phosphate oxidase family protein [Uruburuella testudinis]
MPESIFKQVSLDILRLHQHTARSLLAVQHADEAEIHDAVYVTLEGRYYVLLPDTAAPCDALTGIFLIEADDEQARLSWVATTRAVQRKDTLYRRALAALQRRVQQTKQSLNQAANSCLLELTPQQGRLTISDNKDFALSPHDLMKALYPAAYNMEKFA